MKRFPLFALLIFLLAACNTSTAVPTPTPTPSPASPATFTPTALPVPPPTLEVLAELEGTIGLIYSLDWSPDGMTIVSTGYG